MLSLGIILYAGDMITCTCALVEEWRSTLSNWFIHWSRFLIYYFRISDTSLATYIDGHHAKNSVMTHPLKTCWHQLNDVTTTICHIYYRHFVTAHLYAIVHVPCIDVKESSWSQLLHQSFWNKFYLHLGWPLTLLKLVKLRNIPKYRI